MSPVPTQSKTVGSAPASRVVDIAVQVPPSASLPVALVGVSEADGFTANEVQAVNAEADRFLIQVSKEGALTQPDAASWQNAQRVSDELFRTWYGQDAFMAMDARRYDEAVASTNP